MEYDSRCARRIMYNHEGYPDPTAGKAIRNVEHERLNKLIKEIKQLISENDFELLNRIELLDKRTGKIYK